MIDIESTLQNIDNRLHRVERGLLYTFLLTIFISSVILVYRQGYKRGQLNAIQQVLDALQTPNTHQEAPADPREGEPGQYH